MRLTRDTGMAIDEVLGLCLRKLDELGEGLERRLWAGDQHIGRVIAQTDIAERVHAVAQDCCMCGCAVIGLFGVSAIV